MLKIMIRAVLGGCIKLGISERVLLCGGSVRRVLHMSIVH